MDFLLLTSLSLAVVLIYFALLVQPQPFWNRVSPLPSPHSDPSMPLPPPPRLQRADKPPPWKKNNEPVSYPPPRLQRAEKLPPWEKNNDPVSYPPPLKKKTIDPHHRLPTKQKHRIPPPSKEKLNLGKKIGLLFTGVAAILQVCVVAFLVIKSRQMFKNQYSH